MNTLICIYLFSLGYTLTDRLFYIYSVGKLYNTDVVAIIIWSFTPLINTVYVLLSLFSFVVHMLEWISRK